MLNLTTNFNGDVAQGILMNAFNNSVMFNPSNANVLMTVANKLSVQTLSQTGFATQAYDCDFVSADSSLVDRTLNPAAFMITNEFCKSTLWGTWMSMVMRSNMSTGEAERIEANNVDAFNTYLIDLLTKKVGQELDQIIWASNAANVNPVLTEISGLVEQMVADGTVIDVATPLALTSANIVSQLEKVLSLVPSAVIDSPDFAIYMNRQDFTLFQLFYSNTAGATYANQALTPNFLGYRIVPVAGIPKNTIVATHTPNLVLGTNIASPAISFTVIDMMNTTGEDKIRIRGQFSLDTTYVFGNEIVLHTV